MATTSPTSDRIATLDIVRGVAVMGILAMNIVAFAMPPEAYMNPLAYGTEWPLDLASYAFSFVLVDGKMRGLFSFLFGASMLLVVDRADSKGGSPLGTHYRRMLVLLLFGLIHYYFIWWGDILVMYALIGMLAVLWRRNSVKALIVWGILLLALQLLMMVGSAASAHGLSAAMASNPTPEQVEAYRGISEGFAVPTAERLREYMALYGGSWWGVAHDRLTEHTTEPLFFLMIFGLETLGYMLLGMAALKSGLLTGDWSAARLRKTALVTLAISLPLFALLAWALLADNFTVAGIFTYGLAATTPIRPVTIVGYAALIVLLTRGGGALVERIAAAGRMAFTNYLGTSILMTALFYGWGLGLYGDLSRIELWLPVIAMWGLMLAWSKPWLDRFQYGPLEWLWRSLARGEIQPMRKPSPPSQGGDQGVGARG